MNLTNFDRFKLAEDARTSKIRIQNFYSRIISEYFNRQLISNREEIINSEKDGKNFKTDVLTYQVLFLVFIRCSGYAFVCTKILCISPVSNSIHKETLSGKSNKLAMP